MVMTEQTGPRDVAESSATKITRVELILFSYPMVGVQGGIDMPGVTSERLRLAVTIETRDGAIGSYVGGQANSLAQATACAPRHPRACDGFAREQAYEMIRRQLRKEDRMGAGVHRHRAVGPGRQAARRLGQPAARRRPRRGCQAYASTWFGGDGGGLSTPGGVRRLRRGVLRPGLSRLQDARLDATAAPSGTPQAVRLLGKRVGGRMALMHDAACHFRTFADALAVGRACDEAGFFWYEDPYSDGGLAAHAHRRLRELIKTPLLLGEHVRGLESMATLVLADGTDFVRADPDFDIGITGHDEDRPLRRGARPRRRAACAGTGAPALHGGDPQHQLLRAVDGRPVAAATSTPPSTPAAIPTPRRRRRRTAASRCRTGPASASPTTGTSSRRTRSPRPSSSRPRPRATGSRHARIPRPRRPDPVCGLRVEPAGHRDVRPATARRRRDRRPG